MLGGKKKILCLFRHHLFICIVSKLHMLIDAVTESYNKYFFGDVGREIYDFFWGDFADWYIEASKATIYHSGDDSVALVAQTVLLYIFEHILKLLHPFMPFVTEELWQALPNRREALIISSWPQTSLPRSTDLVKRFENLQALTRAVRNARAEYSVEPAKRITASIVGSEEVIQYISEEKEVLALLSKLDFDNIHFADSPPEDAKQSVHLIASEGLEAYLPLADMVDISAEVQCLSKRLSKMQTEYEGLKARLNSPKKTKVSLLWMSAIHIYPSGGRGQDMKYDRERSRGRSGSGSKDKIDALGRLLTRTLRQMATELNLNMRSDGYVKVEDLLKLNMKAFANIPLRSQTVDDIKEAVRKDNKQRFSLLEENGELQIRANQGHTVMLMKCNFAYMEPIRGIWNQFWSQV
ncbi:valine--tRNA ligase, chloroplastic/mitochondrial 2 isoform X3 [Gossypium raimondii]|uniref:valine--tRNA ligase, chloroplastic/mitochondrial 2 isoform X3 n=1 Tax=Gossypium raimondii TaxID=29730 RepID=UPI00227BD926|nr:valine--tRNA ligase, chloroplastic/mitochondrial 2 isoform X3 [Gossypium raimondii]XP_052477218.1 valine--tRNA ligase, chloroplastic/mitochondrial 2 isoform X3 [Gossypium raimondii]XP_052477223.1 valine--tRNA ligase, chloroplastic/mitochondrial 2 isoform X3 [Gossypium raimondii]